jgi:lysozyme
MNKGIPIIRKFEGLRLKAYICPAGKVTIGWGNTFYENGSKVEITDKITLDRADKLLFFKIGLFEKELSKLVKSAINENQKGALTSFIYNFGATKFGNSTLLKKVNANPDDATIRDEFMRWVGKDPKTINGLRTRRKAEADLYFTAP